MKHGKLYNLVTTLLALASRCLVLMYKVAMYHPSIQCYAISGTLFPISGGRPALPVPSPAAISLLLTPLVTTAGPLVGPARPPCNYPFPTLTNTDGAAVAHLLFCFWSACR
jgi:hypothetical protein